MVIHSSNLQVIHFDGIDNDDDSKSPSPVFVQADFDSVTYAVGNVVVLIDPVTYARTLHTIPSLPDTVYSLGIKFVITAGKYYREGYIGSIVNGVAVPHPSAYDGIDNDLDGLIDENRAIHYETRILKSSAANSTQIQEFCNWSRCK